MNEKIFKTFQDLEVWQVAREFRRRMYGIVKQLPAEEKFNLASQMRRAALSVTNNIAEGHGRYHFQENIQFLRTSRGSLEELLDDLTLCRDESYLPESEIKAAEAEGARVRMLINGYVRYLKARKEGNTDVLRESPVPYKTDEEDV